ncbi:hypothetical protein ACFWYW_19795 [Nonomuraea sp. NPDC059023]|uniref:hypothetical protein n=1 Tax=unclassified Nonomuraea TaxID=2593643 RepID=UPI00368BE69F
MMTEERARARLTAQMDGRRVALRMQWDEVASLAGMSTAHLRRIRKNETAITPLMKAGLEAALRWEQGSVDTVLTGGDPTPLPSAAPGSGPLTQLAAPPEVGLQTEIEQLRDEIAQLAETVSPDVRHLVERAIEEEEQEAGRAHRQRLERWRKLLLDKSSNSDQP